MTEPDRPPTDGHRAFHAGVVARVDSDRAGPDFPADALASIDTAVRRRTARSPGTNLASHLRALDMAAEVDVAAPVESTRAAGRGVKVAIAKTVGWYVGHLGGQVRQLGVATSRAVRATAARIDELEHRVGELEHGSDDDGGSR